MLATGLVKADINPAAGLWVGDVTLQNVNETVNGLNAANQVVSPDPSVTTPVGSPAHLRVILHVNANGVVRLLKGVAIVVTNTTAPSSPTNAVLISDPKLYGQFSSQSGQRITAVGFDFGDGTNAPYALDSIAQAAATAAVGISNYNAATTAAAAAANSQINYFKTNIPPTATATYSNFIQSGTFASAASVAASSAAQSLVGIDASVATSRQIEIATLAAINNLKDANVYLAADGLVLDKVPLTGQLAPGGTVTGTIYLGADHPTNPFRHKFNPIERHGYAITRNITIKFDATTTNLTDSISGTYHENIFGLHKKLGPDQNIGLLTDGVINLQRVCPVASLSNDN